MKIQLITLTLEDGREINTYAPEFCKDGDNLVLKNIQVHEAIELDENVELVNIKNYVKK